MKKTILFITIIFMAALFFSQNVIAVTMAKSKVKCPVCETKNGFMVLMSYGSYVYAKYPLQTVNWPVTQDFPHYICSQCKYAALSWDFQKLPKELIPAVKETLRTIEFNEKFEGRYEDYRDIPISRRLEVAEKVYKLYKKKDEFWSRYYRLMAYHYGIEKKKDKEIAMRKKALSIISEMLQKKEYTGIQKELFLYSGAMKYLLNKNEEALADFKKGLKSRFYQEDTGSVRNNQIDGYYGDYLMEYITILLKAEKEAKSLKWYYEKASCDFLRIFRMGPVTLLFAFILWLAIFSVSFFSSGGLIFRLGSIRKQGNFQLLFGFFLMVFLFPGSYLFLSGFRLLGSIYPAVITGFVWLMAALIFQRQVKKRSALKEDSQTVHMQTDSSGGPGATGFTGLLGEIVSSGSWKLLRVLIFLTPLLMTIALFFRERPEESLYEIKELHESFTRFFQIDIEVLLYTPGVVVLLYLVFYLMYWVVNRLSLHSTDGNILDYIFNIPAFGLVFLGSEIYLGSFNKNFPVQTFILIGTIMFLFSWILERKMNRGKSKREWVIEFRKLLKTRLWFLVRAALLLAPVIIGLCNHWVWLKGS
ncbi:MAG: hypothetical protein GY757_00480 [bacterium]|nr:hypothetical protein [bacterium]